MKLLVRLVAIILLFTSTTQACMAGAQEDLITACKQGNLEGVKAAIAAGAVINQVDAGNVAPIVYAVMWPDVVSFMLEKGADPNLGNNTILYNTVVYYSIDVMKMLIAKGVDINKGIITPGGGEIAMYQKLIDAEKAKGKDANKATIKVYEGLIAKAPAPKGDVKQSPLQLAVGSTNCVECVKLLLDAGAKTDEKDGENGNLVYTLSSSAQEAQVRIDGWKKAMPTWETSYGMKLPDWFKNLDTTRVGKAEDILKLLLKKGLDVNDKNTTYGYTALGRALKYKKVSIAKVLIQNGADPKIASKYYSDGKTLTDGVYPICQAAEVGDLELMKMIVDKGADINTIAKGMALMNISSLTGGDNYTPLILALSNGKTDIASYLIAKGADINIGVEGMAYVRPGNIPANIDLQCLVIVTKKTPIYWAIEAGSLEVVKQLAEKMEWKFNPDFTVRSTGGGVSEDKVFGTFDGAHTWSCKFDKSKYKPSQWAAKMEQSEIKDFLLSKGM